MPKRLTYFFIWGFLLLVTTAQAAESSYRIVVGSGVKLRSAPTADAAVMQVLNIGMVLEEHARQGKWVQVTPEGGEHAGWVAKSLARLFRPGKRARAYRKLARMRLRKDLDFGEQVDLNHFLARVYPEAGSAKEQIKLTLLYLRALKKTETLLSELDWETLKQPPYVEWLKQAQADGEMIYNEPAGMWIVDARLAWRLLANYYPLPAAERLAWFAEELPLPGECEGFFSCNFEWLLHTRLKYLALYPQGKKVDKVLNEVKAFLSDAELDMEMTEAYPALQRQIEVCEVIVERTSAAEKKAVAAQLDKLRQRLNAR